MIQQIKKYIKICSITTKYVLLNRSNTYCHFVWDSAFIQNNGDVFSCFQLKPGIIGNIYRKDLSSMWKNGIKLKMFRLMTLYKCLYCDQVCKILSKKQREETVHHLSGLKHPKTVWIRYGRRCNLRCIMCSQDHHSKISIDSDVMKRNIDWSKVENIMLEGGEILAMKNAKEFYLWLTKTLNKKVNIITNGTLIDNEWAEHLVNGSKEIAISVNAATKETHEAVNIGSDFTKVINNIRMLIEKRNCLNLDTRIIYKYTIIPKNIHEIAEAINFADSLGCSKIHYGYSGLIPSFLKENTVFRERIKKRLDRFMNAKMKIEVDGKTLGQLGLIERRY